MSSQILIEEGAGDAKRPSQTSSTRKPTGEQRQKLSVEQKRNIRKMFDLLDTNKSGSIDVDELANALSKLGIRSLRDELEDVVKNADIDRSGTIEFEEFVTLWSSYRLSIEVEQIPELIALEEMRRPGVLDCLPSILRARETHAVIDKVIGNTSSGHRKPMKAEPLSTNSSTKASHRATVATVLKPPASSGEWLQSYLDETDRLFGEYQSLRNQYDSKYPQARRKAPPESMPTISGLPDSTGNSNHSAIHPPKSRAASRQGSSSLPAIAADGMVGSSLGARAERKNKMCKAEETVVKREESQGIGLPVLLNRSNVGNIGEGVRGGLDALDKKPSAKGETSSLPVLSQSASAENGIVARRPGAARFLLKSTAPDSKAPIRFTMAGLGLERELPFVFAT
eukprot:scaffold310064_cov33-Tisochrysis_lutea.AAC.1